MNKKDPFYSGLICIVALCCLAFHQVDVQLSSDHQITVQLHSNQLLNEKTRKEIKSGISTQMMILSRIKTSSNELVYENLFSLESKYDLWEEVFYITFSDGRKKVVKSQDEVEKIIENPGPIQIGPDSILMKNHSYQVFAIQTINPVNKERFEAVQRWITQQKVTYRGLPSSKDTLNSGTDLETPFSALFYNLWKRASSGELLSGELRNEYQTRLFTLESLKIESKAKH